MAKSNSGVLRVSLDLSITNNVDDKNYDKLQGKLVKFLEDSKVNATGKIQYISVDTVDINSVHTD